MQSAPKVSIVLLNWNGKNDTIECLESLKKVQYPNWEIILVDNGSEDGSPEYFEKNYSNITLIKNKENLGFTGGNNVGIKKALEHGADYVLLLNNDTTVDEQLIQGCLKPFLENKNVGLVGPKVVNYNHPETVWCAGGSYNPILGRAVMYGTVSKTTDFEKADVVDWISFCVVMIKREVFEKIGFLDDAFFSSYEDLDFCLRAKKVGYLCAYSPKVVVKHKIAQDWGGLDNPLYIYYQTRNALLCMKKNRSFFGFLLFFCIYIGVSIQKRSFRLFSINKTNHIQYIYIGLFDFLRKNYYKGVLSEKIRKRIKNKEASPLTIGINARYLQRKLSGIERYIIELIFHLGEIDTQNKYLLFFNKDAPVPTLSTNKNFRSIISSFPTGHRLLRLFWEHLYLCYEIKKHHVSIFHGPAFFVPVFKPKHCKYVVTVHDITFVKYPAAFTWGTRLYYKLLFSRSLQLADAIITDSESTKKDIIQTYHIDPAKISVIYLGLSKPFLEKQEKKRIKEIKERYALPEKYFLFTGVLSPRKNIETMLGAFHLLKKGNAYQAYKLLIVGRRGWLYEGIFAKIAQLQLENEVSFIEYVPEEDLPTFYLLAKAYLFTSLYEGFGLPILEAMASRCPVITSNISSMPEVAGNAALLIDPTKKEEIVSAMKQVIENEKLRKEMQKKGLLQIKKFSWKKTAEETKKIYASLVNKV